ncbi:MAG: membrane dipeptidase, partial [Alphaproteobacteria bacterium]|nr:membrane dipeptidase [Alphaproteobacteria bacterium]
MKPIALAAALLAAAAAAPAMAAKPAESPEARVERVLGAAPVIDGHNDLPWEIRERYDLWRSPLDLRSDTSRLPAPLQTDIPRLRKGHVGAQLWSVYIPVSIKGPAAVLTTLEQMDIVRQMVARYPADFALAATAADIRRIEKEGKIAALMGVEGGHQIALSPAVLRTYYELGARYMTLT